MAHLQLGYASLETIPPMSQEELVRCNTKTSHDQGIRNVPVSRFVCHIPGFGVDDFDRLLPLRIIDFILCRLMEVQLSRILVNIGKGFNLSDRM